MGKISRSVIDAILIGYWAFTTSLLGIPLGMLVVNTFNLQTNTNSPQEEIIFFIFPVIFFLLGATVSLRLPHSFVVWFVSTVSLGVGVVNFIQTYAEAHTHPNIGSSLFLAACIVNMVYYLLASLTLSVLVFLLNWIRRMV